MDLLGELEAPRLVAPRPLDACARFCDWARTPRVLLLRSSIDFVADHEEEISEREERHTGGVWFVMMSKVPSLCCLFPSLPYCCPTERRLRLRLFLAIMYSAAIDRLICQTELHELAFLSHTKIDYQLAELGAVVK